MTDVAALFVDPQGIYPELLGAERCWDEERDARTYWGNDPVVAHPPCGRWCAMAKMNERRWGAKVGDDDGCFAAALAALSRCGGVLEHPAQSLAFAAFSIPKPKADGWQKLSNTVWICTVFQAAYGHLATKATWLIYKGRRPPFELNWRKVRGTHQIGGGVHTGNRSLPRLPDHLTHATPRAFAAELIRLAAWSRG